MASSRTRELRFGLWFVAIAAVLFILYGFPYAEDSTMRACLEAYLRAYAAAAGRFLALFDAQVRVSGQDILGRYPLRIIKTCDAVEVKVLFVAAVLAYPTRFRWRVLAASAGVALLFVANVLRICSLYFVGIYLPDAFHFVHIEFWPFLLVGLSAGLFLAWATWAREREARDATA